MWRTKPVLVEAAGSMHTHNLSLALISFAAVFHSEVNKRQGAETSHN